MIFTNAFIDSSLVLYRKMWRLLLINLLLVVIKASQMDDERALAKDWFNEHIHPMFPFTPTTVGCLIFAIYYLITSFIDYASAEASHILISKGENPEKTLKELKKEIKNDPAKFAALAKKHSECPSGQDGGSLGKFKRNVMAPPFDRAVFDPNIDVGTVIGPIQTSFGWHLIYVHKRRLQ